MNCKTGYVSRFVARLIILIIVSVAAVEVTQIEYISDAIVDTMPVFDDVTEENKLDIELVYINGIMSPSGGGGFGVDDPMTKGEAAYIAVWMYENMENIPHTYHTYYVSESEYTDKAIEYGILPQQLTDVSEQLTREEAGALLARFVYDDGNIVSDISNFEGSERFTYKNEVIALYSRGITLNENIYESYSPDLIITRGEMAKLITMIYKPQMRIVDLMPDYPALKAMLEEMMSKYDGDWSLYFSDYETKNSFSINNHQVYSASLVKLFVIQAVYEMISSGQMKDSNEIEELLRRMITYSDNDAWMSITRRIGGTHMNGMKKVTDIAGKAGFTSSGQFIQGDKVNYNFTSVEDCGKYLERVLDGELVSPEYSSKILELLKRQQVRHKIPAGVPEGVEVANKTGELEYVEGDAAIVFAPFGTYILVIIGDDLENSGQAQINIRNMSRAVYDFLFG